ncbi:MAG TPA: hypothetical protein VGR09_05505, partial [Gemmatimonadales bacterium]|nr:hypothetical protein [Gemmatimonadales bacterium]
MRPATEGRAAPRTPALTTTIEPLEYFRRTQAALGDRYRLQRTIAATHELALFEAWDQLLKRRVSLRVDVD